MFQEWGFLLGEIWVLLLLAALLGLFVGWLIWGRVSAAFAAREAEYQRKIKQRDDRIVELERDAKRLTTAAEGHDALLKSRDTQITSLQGDLDGMKAIADGHAGAVKQREERIAALEAELASQRADGDGQLEIANARDAALSENASLVARLQTLESREADLQGRVSSNDGLAEQLRECRSSGAQKDQRIAELEASLAARSAAPAADTSIPDYDRDGVHEGVNEGTKPMTLTAARDGGADDLKRIKGVGPKLEKMLHGLGFFHFDQVAAWSDQEIAWVDANLEGFNGRVSRDRWVEQAKLLASGGETEFSRRVDGGDVYE